MTRDQFDAFCRSLPATTFVIQWGGSHVWKVGGKVFAISSERNVSERNASGGEPERHLQGQRHRL